ncbi:MAG: hypothetical protein AB1Z98_34990 [Nannocystaceae bacterium]
MALQITSLYFVGGLSSRNLSTVEQSLIDAPPPGRGYWVRNGNWGFVTGAMRYFGLQGSSWRNVCKFTSEPFGFVDHRMRTGVDHLDPLGRKYRGIRQYTSYMWDQNFGITGPGQGVVVITHSMGAAYSMGLMEKMHGRGIPIAMAVHINPFQPASGACTPSRDFHVHVQTDNDIVTRDVPLFGSPVLDIVNLFEGVIKQPGWIAGAKPIMRPGPFNPTQAHYGPISDGEAFWFPNGARAAFGHDHYDHSP